MVEITASGRNLRAIYAYILRDVGERTAVTLDSTVIGMPAALAWLTSAISSVYPSRVFATEAYRRAWRLDKRPVTQSLVATSLPPSRGGREHMLALFG